MKTSLVIAATNGNFPYLSCILAHYRDGTIKPDQVVISISNAHLVNPIELYGLKRKYSSIFEDLKILEHNQTMIQGPNRDAASMAADNEIVISNDADDFPHPQRIEIIKHFFENYDILHLNHGYQTQGDKTFDPININDIQVLDKEQTYKWLFPNYNGEAYHGRRPNPKDYGYQLGCYGGYGAFQWIHAGCPAFHKSVFNALRWRNEEEYAWDYDFVFDVAFYFKKTIMINSKLMWYNMGEERRNSPSMENLYNLYKE